MTNSNPFFRLEQQENDTAKSNHVPEENQPLFTERKKPHSFLLGVVFTSLKMTVLAFIVGNALGVLLARWGGGAHCR